jgi:hypothetical protein
MEHDQNARKGTPVTKPIDLKAKDLRAKKAGVPSHGKAEKSQSTDLRAVAAAKEARPSTAVSTLGAARVRKTAPKPEIIEQIGLRLRGCYNDVLMQPIPDRFIDLLSQLEARPSAPHQGAHGTPSKKDAK